MGSQDHETGRVRSGDTEIFYRRFGRPGRTPVLIVHGLSYFSYDWIGPAAGIASATPDHHPLRWRQPRPVPLQGLERL